MRKKRVTLLKGEQANVNNDQALQTLSSWLELHDLDFHCSGVHGSTFSWSRRLVDLLINNIN